MKPDGNELKNMKGGASPPAGHVGLCDHKAGEEVEDRDHVGGAHCRNLQVGSQSNSYHPCKTYVLSLIPKRLFEFRNVIPTLEI